MSPEITPGTNKYVQFTGVNMKHEIAVSVIIPVYNAEKTIKSLIEDILIEDRINIEVIIVNDGSSDNTSTIINSIKDGRVQVIEQNNKGVYAARNNGLDKHKGQWVMFLDADDDVSEGFIYNRYIQASSHNADVLLSNAWKLWHEGDNKKPVHTNQPYDEVLSGNAWMSHAVKVREWPHYLWLQIVRSDYIRNNNLSFHDGRSHKDILWTMELALANGRFYISKDMDYTYKYNNESITNRGDYFDVRAECYIDVISKTIGHAKSIKNNDLSVSLFRHALYEARHFLGLYRKKVRDKEKIRRLFVREIAYKDLIKGVYSLSDIFFLLKVFVKTKNSLVLARN